MITIHILKLMPLIYPGYDEPFEYDEEIPEKEYNPDDYEDFEN